MVQDLIYALYVHIFRFEQKHQKSLQEIRIVARLIVLNLNHNALLISSVCLLGDKLIASGLLIINLSEPYNYQTLIVLLMQILYLTKYTVDIKL